MQEKKRYILVTFDFPSKLSKEDASKLVQHSILDGIGELGASKAKAFLKEFDEETQSGIIKCQTAMLKEVLACIALKTAYDSIPVAIRTSKVSGAICNVWRTPKARQTREPRRTF
ncbi:MAG: Rpp14/Pop5 family protein [Candidatus Micrarchaeia archaeon]|jgi:RNase P/RNase MRP subunit POP5